MQNVLWNLFELARGSFAAEDAPPFILLLLAWKKLEKDPRVEGVQRISEVLLYPDLKDLMGAMQTALSQVARLTGGDNLELNPYRMRHLSAQSAYGLLQCADAANVQDLDVDAFLPCFSEFSRRSEVLGVVPAALADLMVSLADVESGAEVYAPFDSSFTVVLRAAQRDGEAYAEVRNPEVAMMLRILSYLLDLNIRVSVSDPLVKPSWLADSGLRRFMVTVSAPPFGLRLRERAPDPYGRFPERTLNGDVLQIRHILSQSKRRCVVLVSNALLFKVAGSEGEFKADLISRGQVSAVIALPAGLLGNTGISTSLLILNPEGGERQILFVNATVSHYVEQGRQRGSIRLRNIDELVETVIGRRETPYSRLVSHDEVAKNEYILQPDRYALVGEQRLLEGVLAEAKTVPLSEIAELIRPQALRQEEGEEVAETFVEVTVQDIGEDGYVQQPGKQVGVGRRLLPRARQQAARAEDILLVVKGGIGKAGMVPLDVKEPWLVNQSFLIIRMEPNPHLSSPVVLLRYLTSPTGRALLSRLSGGSSIPILQANDIRSLPVVVPPLEEQEAVVATSHELVELHEQIRALQSQAEELRQRHWGLGEPLDSKPVSS